MLIVGSAKSMIALRIMTLSFTRPARPIVDIERVRNRLIYSPLI